MSCEFTLIILIIKCDEFAFDYFLLINWVIRVIDIAAYNRVTREEFNIVVWIDIGVGLIINYKKSKFGVEEAVDTLDDSDINIFIIGAINALIESVKGATSFKRLIIRCFFNIFFAADADTIVRYYYLFEDL